jgi:hypothetical protein
LRATFDATDHDTTIHQLRARSPHAWLLLIDEVESQLDTATRTRWAALLRDAFLSPSRPSGQATSTEETTAQSNQAQALLALQPVEACAFLRLQNLLDEPSVVPLLRAWLANPQSNSPTHWSQTPAAELLPIFEIAVALDQTTLVADSPLLGDAALQESLETYWSAQNLNLEQLERLAQCYLQSEDTLRAERWARKLATQVATDTLGLSTRKWKLTGIGTLISDGVEAATKSNASDYFSTLHPIVKDALDKLGSV